MQTSVSVLLPAVSSSRLVSRVGVKRYQTFGQKDVYGSSAARVAALTSAVAVNGSAATTVALSKSSFGGVDANAGVAWTRKRASATSAPRTSLPTGPPSDQCQTQRRGRVARKASDQRARSPRPTSSRRSCRALPSGPASETGGAEGPRLYSDAGGARLAIDAQRRRDRHRRHAVPRRFGTDGANPAGQRDPRLRPSDHQGPA